MTTKSIYIAIVFTVILAVVLYLFALELTPKISPVYQNSSATTSSQLLGVPFDNNDNLDQALQDLNSIQL